MACFNAGKEFEDETHVNDLVMVNGHQDDEDNDDNQSDPYGYELLVFDPCLEVDFFVFVFLFFGIFKARRRQDVVVAAAAVLSHCGFDSVLSSRKSFSSE
jgi:hypothetical protein